MFWEGTLVIEDELLDNSRLCSEEEFNDLYEEYLECDYWREDCMEISSETDSEVIEANFF